MVRVDEIRSRLRQAVGRAFLIAAASAFVPGLAHAHFILIAPDSWMSQDSFGLPEKLGPCGDEGGGTPTAAVTAFRSGQAISVTINEVIYHPGHYRVALAVSDRSELPPEPTVTPKAGDPCGSAAIQNPPTFPILADNVLPHTQPFAGPQTFTVTLPTDVTCTKCTLQVLEFMSSHPAPCFYHHCADLSIQPELVSTTSTVLTGSTTTTMPACSTPPCPDPVGDCNLDGTFDLFDVLATIDLVLGTRTPTAEQRIACDANCDGHIDLFDVLTDIDALLGRIETPPTCPSQTTTTTTVTTTTQPVLVSFRGDVQPIFTARCALVGCHSGPFPTQGLNLGDGSAYAALVNSQSTERPDLKLIAPGSTAASYLWWKVGQAPPGQSILGSPMPLTGGPLSLAQMATIRGWITEGAPDN